MFSTNSKGSNDPEGIDEAMEKIRKLGYKKSHLLYTLQTEKIKKKKKQKGDLLYVFFFETDLLYVLRSVIQSLLLLDGLSALRAENRVFFF